MPDQENPSPARVLVLGAGGFIGGRTVAALARTSDLRPIAAVRRGRPTSGPASLVCDATDRAALARALEGVEYAVNCVAGEDDTMVKATEALCDTARRSGLRRLVHLSSMAVYGEATGTVRETSAAVPPLSGYGRAKQVCEQVVRDFMGDGGDAVILRPGCVYGPGSEQWTGRIARLLQTRRLGDLGAAGDGVCNLTYIDDLVAAILSALRHDAASGEAFNIAMADPPDWNGYLVRFARMLGETPVRRLPDRQLTLECKLAAPALRLGHIGVRIAHLPLRVPDAITPSLAKLFRQDIRLDVRKSLERLGIRETSLECGLTASAEWIAGQQRGPSAQPRSTSLEAQQR